MLHIDTEVFHFINSGLSNSFFDFLMPVLREKLVWLPLYLFIVAFMIWNYKPTSAILFILFLAFTVSLTDFISSKLIKENVERVRPCNQQSLQDELVLRVSCGSGYSFTSSHAANHFSLALFLIYTIGRSFKFIRWPLIFWASLISFAQVYVGVHYPLDIIFGAFLGICIGMIMSLIYNLYISESIYP